MCPKKSTKVQSRWKPLPEEASTMQVMFIPDIDEHTYHLEDMSNEDLKKCIKLIDQSNKTLEVENEIIERYLNKMDPNSLAKMTQILEVAAVALQKAERAAHLGGGNSSLSLGKDALGSRLTDDSTSSSSRAGTPQSTMGPHTKLGLFGLVDKGPKVQTAQKIDLVNRVIDELKTLLEDFRKKAKNFNYILKCRREEMSERLMEITELQSNFEHKLLIEGLDPVTGKLPGEKFIRYLETKLKMEEIVIDRMRFKTGALKSQLKKLRLQLAQKEDLGEILHPVDFEQLQIENKICQEHLDGIIVHVIDMKKVNGKFGSLLNVHQKKLHEQMNRMTELQNRAIFKEKMITQLTENEEKVKSEVHLVAKAVNKISSLMKSYTVPELIEYIKKKAELHDLKKNIKICERQVKLKDLALATQVHKIKSIQEVFSKTQGHDPLSLTTFKESRIFF